MVDYDQDNLEVCKSVLKTRDGMERLALYQNSIGRLVLLLCLYLTFII